MIDEFDDDILRDDRGVDMIPKSLLPKKLLLSESGVLDDVLGLRTGVLCNPRDDEGTPV
jgi:hypothetical protein